MQVPNICWRAAHTLHRSTLHKGLHANRKTRGLTHRSHNIMADTEQHTEDTHDPQFEPVIRLTEQVESKTHEEDEEVVFKM